MPHAMTIALLHSLSIKKIEKGRMVEGFIGSEQKPAKETQPEPGFRYKWESRPTGALSLVDTKTPYRHEIHLIGRSSTAKGLAQHRSPTE